MEYSLDKSLKDSLASEDLFSLGELTEPLIDSFIKNDGLKEIPIIGTVGKLYSVGKDIKNYFYTRKIYDFLFCLKDIPTKKRREFIDSINSSKKKNHEFGETVLLLLERADSFRKPIVIGNIIKALIKEELEYEIAMRLCSMVDKCYYPDLEYLIDFKFGIQDKPYVADSLTNIGFLEKNVADLGKVFDDEPNDALFENTVDEYQLTLFGKLLKKYGFENE